MDSSVEARLSEMDTIGVHLRKLKASRAKRQLAESADQGTAAVAAAAAAAAAGGGGEEDEAEAGLPRVATAARRRRKTKKV